MTQMRMLMPNGNVRVVDVPTLLVLHPEREPVKPRYNFLNDDGNIIPIINMFDFIGEPTVNPLHAFSAVAYVGEPGAKEHEWLAIEVKPGEIWHVSTR